MVAGTKCGATLGRDQILTTDDQGDRYLIRKTQVGQATPRGGTAVALPSGGDDDIVARQLREAAQRETDPVLREKLWDEYRKYKGGL